MPIPVTRPNPEIRINRVIADGLTARNVLRRRKAKKRCYPLRGVINRFHNQIGARSLGLPISDCKGRRFAN